MKRFTWYLRLITQSLGGLGLAGIGLLVFGFILQVIIIQPVKRDVTQLQSQLSNIKENPQKIESFVPTQGQQLAMMYDFFPQSSMLPEQLKIFHQITDTNGLYLGKVDYKLSKVSGTPLERYDISYEITTDYPMLRQYIADLLIKLPNAALSSIDLQRVDNEGEVPEAKLNIVLYYRKDS